MEGSVVEGGEVLFRLNGTRVLDELDIVRNRMFEALARKNRLMAQREYCRSGKRGRKCMCY